MTSNKLRMLAIPLGIAAMLFQSTAVNATWMDDFYTSAGAAANVTGPSAYHTQQYGVISGGGVSWRVPQQTTQLFGFTPPGYKAGCGGIDLWAGSFSFINKAQFVALLRNIGQNAAGYFFQIALQSAAPEINSELSKLENELQKMNQFGINSCKLGEQLAQGPATEVGQSLRQVANNVGSGVMGLFQDNTDADTSTSSSPATTASTISQVQSQNPGLVNDAGGNPVIPTGPFNALYNALMQNNGGSLFTTGVNLSPDQIDILTSLLGTEIITPATSNANSGVQVLPISPTLTWGQFIGPEPTTVGVTNNLTANVRQCALATGAQSGNSTCIYAGDSDGINTNYQYTGFSQMIYNSLNDIWSSIVNRTPLNPSNPTDAAAIQLIGMTSVPAYSLLSKTTALDSITGGGTLTQETISVYSDIIAAEAAESFVRTALGQADQMMRGYKTKEGKAMRDSLIPLESKRKQVLQEVESYYQNVLKNESNRIVEINNSIQFGQMVASNMNTHLADNIKFRGK